MKSRPPLSAYQREQDEWQTQMWDQCTQAIGGWLLDAQIDLRRPLRSLKHPELAAMAVAAIGTYNDQREARRQEEAKRRQARRRLEADPRQLEMHFSHAI
jgi:hypothetical protein